jgi:sporulation protein YlmC with PRC-barrel domain
MTTASNVLEWRGQELLDNDGQKIGTIEEIYLDTETDQPEWALVKTGLFGGKGTFVPLQQANPSGDGVQVPFEKSHVKDAPNIDPDGQLSQSEEQTLYQHYGLARGRRRHDRHDRRGLVRRPAAGRRRRLGPRDRQRDDALRGGAGGR